ncbi:H-2 class II histocompatibility antigen, E-S beta chain-like isoform X1 [Oreochromis niloticus]|uniref:H-2 class II histocompatibility antigen, E-S beta chain-like isoform X1 n=1 Tax=Oreochromis niloticus TaxID=8128 RepID=UPI000904A9F2|nr:H-2 class II histocompatibility antigen, E-S beta chain-like isoform X1 [Oreochromis niloticus]
MASSFVCFTLLLISIHTADGFLEYMVERCKFNSTELKDMEYIYSHYYNKIEYIRFSSSVGKYVGVTEFGENLAKHWNNDTEELNSTRSKIVTYCLNNIDIHDRAILAKSVQPRVRIKSKTPLSGQHPAMLVCSVYDFFPTKIKVSWLRDGQEVYSDVTSTEVMPNGDWYYQTHSHLEYKPRSGEKISCVVEHASLSEPLITDWDPSSDKSTSESTTLIAFGASILTLGLILLLVGYFFYRWKAGGQTRTHTQRPVNSTSYQSC